MIRSIFLASAALAFAGCQSTEPAPRRLPHGVSASSYGPVTAFADTELFGENPLQAFQRTGAQPLPLASLPVGMPLQIQSRSGAFFQVVTPSGLAGWVAARNVSNATEPVPDWSGAAFAPSSQRNTPQIAPGILAPEPPAGNSDSPDTIDLDRLPPP